MCHGHQAGPTQRGCTYRMWPSQLPLMALMRVGGPWQKRALLSVEAPSLSHIDGFVVRGHGSFLDGFAERGWAWQESARLLFKAPSLSHVDGLVVRGHGSFLDGFTEGGVTVAGAGNVFCGGAILHGQHALGDELAGVGPHDVSAQHLVCGRVRHKLDHAIGVVHRLGSAVGHEGELARLQDTHQLSQVQVLRMRISASSTVLARLLAMKGNLPDCRTHINSARCRC